MKWLVNMALNTVFVVTLLWYLGNIPFSPPIPDIFIQAREFSAVTHVTAGTTQWCHNIFVCRWQLLHYGIMLKGGNINPPPHPPNTYSHLSGNYNTVILVLCWRKASFPLYYHPSLLALTCVCSGSYTVVPLDPMVAWKLHLTIQVVLEEVVNYGAVHKPGAGLWQ